MAMLLRPAPLRTDHLAALAPTVAPDRALHPQPAQAQVRTRASAVRPPSPLRRSTRKIMHCQG